MTNKKKDSLFSRIKSKLFNSSEEDEFETVEDEIDPSELDEYETRYHGDDGDDFEADDDELSDEEREAILRKELGEDYSPVINDELLAGSEEIDKTDPGFVLSEEVKDDPADLPDDSLNFPEESEFADDSDEDEVLEALESEASLSLDKEDEIDELEEDDEPFEAQPMVLSEEDKEEIEDEMEELEEVFPEIPQEMPKPDRTREIDLSAMEEAGDESQGEDYDDYDEEEGDFSEFQVPGKKDFKEKALAALSSLKNLIPKKGHKPSFTPKKGPSFKFLERFDWDAVYSKIFAAESRPAIHRGFLAILFAISTYGVGKLTALAIKGTNPPTATTTSTSAPRVAYKARPQMNTVAQTDLFNAPGIEKEPTNIGEVKKVKKADEKKVCATSNKESSLSIKLVNTLVLQDSVKSIAAVQVRNQKDVLNLREGEKILDMAQIGKIDRQKMVFKNLKTGTCEYIANVDKNLKKMTPLNILSPKKGKKLLDKSKDGIENSGNSYKIPSKVREEMLSNISEVLTQARAIQITNPDGSLSFKLTEIVPNSIYSKLDIQNDDIIRTINGKKITNINEVMTLFGNIRQIDRFELGILRNGTEVNKEYDFE